jgi:hypothetical protein
VPTGSLFARSHDRASSSRMTKTFGLNRRAGSSPVLIAWYTRVALAPRCVASGGGASIPGVTHLPCEIDFGFRTHDFRSNICPQSTPYGSVRTAMEGLEKPKSPGAR